LFQQNLHQNVFKNGQALQLPQTFPSIAVDISLILKGVKNLDFPNSVLDMRSYTDVLKYFEPSCLKNIFMLQSCWALVWECSNIIWCFREEEGVCSNVRVPSYGGGGFGQIM